MFCLGDLFPGYIVYGLVKMPLSSTTFCWKSTEVHHNWVEAVETPVRIRMNFRKSPYNSEKKHMVELWQSQRPWIPKKA